MISILFVMNHIFYYEMKSRHCSAAFPNTANIGASIWPAVAEAHASLISKFTVNSSMRMCMCTY